MTRLTKTGTQESYERLHHPNGAHRGSARSANGSDLDHFEQAIRPHLAEHEARINECGTAFAHTPDRDIDPGPDCVFCGARIDGTVANDRQEKAVAALSRIARELRSNDAAPLEWAAFTGNEERFPPVRGEHGIPLGHAAVSASTAVFPPALWLSVDDGEEDEATLHLHAWAARRLGVQLIAMAEEVDPGGGAENPDHGLAALTPDQLAAAHHQWMIDAFSGLGGHDESFVRRMVLQRLASRFLDCESSTGGQHRLERTAPDVLWCHHCAITVAAPNPEEIIRSLIKGPEEECS